MTEPAELAGIARAVRAAPALLGRVRLVAVDGPSGAGKSTFADALAAELRKSLQAESAVRIVRTDDFATWEQPVAWWPRLHAGVLDPLSQGLPGRYQRVEWPNGEPVRGAFVRVPVPEVLVLEGVSAGRASIAAKLSQLIWVGCGDQASRLAAAVARDGEACREPLRRWQEFEKGWFAVDHTPERANSVISGPGVLESASSIHRPFGLNQG
ncbi:uridine kinase [Tamaricihabitans halophyticus]|uniref:Uridine kinase n=1 Tax=Tamaricihabitans halophyticus TaxID=1262583 RepID=A0A4R2QVV7_9PSEU|nr:(d)CMP kinase [Tamaricihabitans halophyticus]TCP54220.1 uridine kinase [Tamaricihabitans halophyticus]